ncbi:hypothetical protein H0W91_02205 [Patescibacteria group bacterium]|nr:hypothetical protein [Patescibacteria group bacterium]
MSIEPVKMKVDGFGELLFEGEFLKANGSIPFIRAHPKGGFRVAVLLGFRAGKVFPTETKPCRRRVKIIMGSGTFIMNGVETPFSRNSTFNIPPGAVHRLETINEATLLLLSEE